MVFPRKICKPSDLSKVLDFGPGKHTTPPSTEGGFLDLESVRPEPASLISPREVGYGWRQNHWSFSQQ